MLLCVPTCPPSNSSVIARRVPNSRAADGVRITLGPRSGIVDPTKVVQLALENAVSVAGVLQLTEATMTEPAEPPKHERGAVEQ
jgi:chaperonin GroEL (HSP60 family)